MSTTYFVVNRLVQFADGSVSVTPAHIAKTEADAKVEAQKLNCLLQLLAQSDVSMPNGQVAPLTGVLGLIGVRGITQTIATMEVNSPLDVKPPHIHLVTR